MSPAHRRAAAQILADFAQFFLDLYLRTETETHDLVNFPKLFVHFTKFVRMFRFILVIFLRKLFIRKIRTAQKNLPFECVHFPDTSH